MPRWRTASTRGPIGYSYEATRVLLHHGQPVAVPHTVHRPPDVRACIFWLRNRRPQQWRAGGRPAPDEGPDLQALEEFAERARRAGAQSASGQAGDVRPADGEFPHHAVVAPVEMIEAAEPRLAAGAEARDDKRGGRADVGSDHGRSVKPVDAADEGGAAADGDARAHPDELVDVPEALLEDRLADSAGAGRRSPATP